MEKIDNEKLIEIVKKTDGRSLTFKKNITTISQQMGNTDGYKIEIDCVDSPMGIRITDIRFIGGCYNELNNVIIDLNNLLKLIKPA